MKLICILTVLLFSIANLSSAERPDLEIGIKAYFICEKTKSLSGVQFAKFCKTHNSLERYLYVIFDPSVSISISDFYNHDQKLAGTKDWCYQEIDDGRRAPTCMLMVRDPLRHMYYRFLPTFIDKNLARMRIRSLPKGRFYRLHLQELGSGSNASSQAFVFYNPF
jgi:hypothetical protein